jgi:hypothetical protein
MLSAMGNLQLERMLDPKYLDLDGTAGEEAETELFAILQEDDAAELPFRG